MFSKIYNILKSFSDKVIQSEWSCLTSCEPVCLSVCPSTCKTPLTGCSDLARWGWRRVRGGRAEAERSEGEWTSSVSSLAAAQECLGAAGAKWRWKVLGFPTDPPVSELSVLSLSVCLSLSHLWHVMAALRAWGGEERGRRPGQKEVFYSQII